MPTSLPEPGVTPPNWGQQLNDGIESRYVENKAEIDAEELARANGDVVLQDGVDAEEAARIAGDAGLQSQIDPIEADLAGRLSDATLSDTYGRAAAASLKAVDTPAGFSWTTHPLVGKLFVDQFGQFTTTLDPTTLKAPAGTTYYVDVVDGNNANTGLAPGAGNAFKSLSTAVAAAGVGTIVVKGYGPVTPYSRTNGGFNGTAITKNINIIGDGDAYITTHDVPSWSLTAGQTKTYQTTRSNVAEVVDMFSGAPGVKYTNVGSVAAVEATAGTWFQNGSVVCVHPLGDRVADALIWPLLSVINFRNTGDFTTYIEGCKFYGGSECIRAAGGSSTGGFLTLNNVEAHMASNGSNNIAVNGCDAVLYRVDGSRAGADGVGYHVLNGKAPRAVEIDCRFTDCGHSSDDQCSSMHDDGKIIRVSGTYRQATGANVADVNDGTESWNLGCIAEDSDSGYNFKAGNDAGTVKMWLDQCVGSDAHWSVYAHGTAQVKQRGSRFERTNVLLTAY